MTIDVHPDSLRTFGRTWDQAADAMPAQAETLAAVGHGADNFGPINQFLTPAVSVFVGRARDLAQECGEHMEQAAWAVRGAADDLETADADVARLMGGEMRTDVGVGAGTAASGCVTDEGVWA